MSVQYDFSGQVALVTGAASGMGLATARAFAEAGAAVTLADLGGEALDRAVEAITTAGGKAMGVACDVTDEAQVAATVERTVSDFGRLDMAYNNAGIQVPTTDVADLTYEDFEKVNAVNYCGVWACMKHELQHMRGQGSGAIVNCSSIGGLICNDFGMAAYHGSKHAVIGITRSAALEYAGRGIRINAVCPGTIATPMVTGMLEKGELKEEDLLASIPLDRLGQPEEIASTVLWLCSPGSSFVTAQSIFVDGGFVWQ
ncbi:SDR family NAD(P)-dependent oxidoreductase [Henriciella aquimarina]|uniref:SDR family NAD(P)-dependent oxidoreductase n=1 Tax=Henriciella aquimarina TaxID=545261 RepID=UPI000A0288CA|nr:glucose 1-dehydrogenase [Henriciella aquimarina]